MPAAVEYANVCRIVATPEELIWEFSVHVPAAEAPRLPVNLTARLVTGWYTAKRLLHILKLSIDRHEAAFGALETDVHRRVAGHRG